MAKIGHCQFLRFDKSCTVLLALGYTRSPQQAAGRLWRAQFHDDEEAKRVGASNVVGNLVLDLLFPCLT